MKNFYFFYLLLLIFIIGISCSKLEDYSNNQKVVIKLDQLTDELIGQKKIPGLIISISAPQKGLFYQKAKGFADLSTLKPMTSDCLYRTGSFTKTFTGAIMLQLISEGKINLNDKISKYFPELSHSSNINIRQLLNMSSGIYEYSKDTYYQNELIKNPQKEWQTIDIVHIALSHPLDFIPGSKWEYSNTNTLIAGLIIEKVTGESFKTNIENRIIKKLGLKNTFFQTNCSMPNKKYCKGYNLNYDGIHDVTVTYHQSNYGAAGSLVTNVQDASSWLRMQMGDFMISNPFLLFEKYNYIPMNDNNEGYGLAVMKIGKGFIGHSGGIPGYSSISLYHPQNHATVVIMFNMISNINSSDIPRAIDFFYKIQDIAFQEL